jgi:hypothetical protein
MYDVKAEKSGFKVATRSGVELQVQQTARVDFGLEVGQVSETIESAERSRFSRPKTRPWAQLLSRSGSRICLLTAATI